MSIEKRIAAVLLDQWVPSHVVYGTDEPVGFESPRDWAEYVAEVLASALGLTRETADDFELGKGWPKEYGVSRYVTEWVADE